MPTTEEIKNYYDEHTIGKLEGFINSNERVERAWLTLVEYARNPRSVLEIGCGIGDICWRISKNWKDANVAGIDISPKSIEFANKLFASDKVKFVSGVLTEETFSSTFDLIILMDVYEHIRQNDRQNLHQAINKIASPNCIVLLSFPTPRHLAYLKAHYPEQIQPVDEDITISVIQKLANDLEMYIVLYKEVSVWHQGDYVHVVLSKREWKQESDRKDGVKMDLKSLLKNKLKEKFSRKADLAFELRQERLLWAKEKLNIDINVLEKLY